MSDLYLLIPLIFIVFQVDGRPLHGYTNHDAVEVLRSTGKSVKLRLARYLRGAKYQQLQLAIGNIYINTSKQIFLILRIFLN